MRIQHMLSSIASIGENLCLVRSSARAVTENRPLRGQLEILATGDDTARINEIEARLADKFEKIGIEVVVFRAKDRQTFIEKQSLGVNRLFYHPATQKAQTDEFRELDCSADMSNLTAPDLFDVCVRLAEVGAPTCDAQCLQSHPAASRFYAIDRRVIRRQLTQILLGRCIIDGVKGLDELGMLSLLLPEVAALRNFHLSSPHHHKDVFEHTLNVVRQAVPSPTVRWAALLHDIGKVHTRSFTSTGKVHFFRHDEVGAYLGDGVMHRLAFSDEMRRQIRTLILLHLRPGLYTPDWSDAAVRRLINEAGDTLELLFDLARADNTTKRMSKRLANLRNVKALSEHCKRVITETADKKVSLPSGLGHAIKEHFELQPGPRIGELCALCHQGMINGTIAPNSSVEEHLAFLRNAPDLMNS